MELSNMKPVSIVLLAVLSSCIVFSRAEEPAPRVPPNAALKYWQAFSMLSAYTGGDRRLIDLAGKAPPSPERDQLARSLETPLKLMHRGAEIPFCDWG